ncbi:hypothetical protein GGQ22_20180 [Nocardioides sp. zg-579]|uniref:Uncharacterized protein n=1 Tax=Nocardioides marmotae TaxID=2663857 RepID=A0A6I3JGY3_9ACTN|nr:hypothetical protein [Nocardioides marmotae]MCR6033731.1 hypothetical protein [Gordonia jinghuaiqii]MTB97389.1 hypothetical protein [Nocardioides marmotae]QKE01725.1 hypothetical protein HPC71_12080 [Nocardioides marmotae]
MIRPGWGLLAPLLLLTPLTACSQDPHEAYCEVVEEQRPDLSETVADGSPAALLEALPSLEALEDAAPRDLRDEWDLVTGRVRELRDALADAGLDPATYDRAESPAGVTEAERARIDAAARELVARATVEALAGVQQQARDVCGTPLTL